MSTTLDADVASARIHQPPPPPPPLLLLLLLLLLLPVRARCCCVVYVALGNCASVACLTVNIDDVSEDERH